MRQTAPAGWYPDPENPTQERYWDGAAWTQNVAPAAPSEDAPQVFELLRLTKRSLIGWTVLVCIAAVITGAVVYSDAERIHSQPSPVPPSPVPIGPVSELSGRHYTIGAFSPTPGKWDGIDPVIRQLLADRDRKDPRSEDNIMSIDFGSGGEVTLVYLGETYRGRFTNESSTVNVAVDAPAFPGGLSGTLWTSDGEDISIHELTLHSNEFTYKLWGTKAPELVPPPRREYQPPPHK